jgi:hypothetical protein
LWCGIFFCPTRCGCIKRPAFPRPDFEGQDENYTSREKDSRGEIADSYLAVIARSESDETIHSCFAARWIASLTLAMTVVAV